MALTLKPLTRREKRMRDKEWQDIHETFRFSRVSRRASVERAAWSAIASGLLLEEGIIVR